MDKRGQVEFTLGMFLKLLGLTLFALIAVKLLVGYYSTYDLDTSEVRAHVLTSRIIYSPHLSYHVGERSYTGVINISKFTTENLEKMIIYDSELVAAGKVELLTAGGETVKDPIYFNKERYDVWAPLARAQVEGPGSANVYTTITPVTVISDSGSSRRFMKIEVLTR